MKVWILVGFFSLSAAPAFALESLTEAPVERIHVVASFEAVTTAQVEVKRENAKPPPLRQPVQLRARTAEERRQETEEAAERRRAREEQRRRRNGINERVPDAVLMGGRGAL